MPLGIKTGPTPGVTSWNERNKDVEFICGENDSGERSRAIMALLYYNVFCTSLKLSTNQWMDRWTRTLLIGTMKQPCCNAKSKSIDEWIDGPIHCWLVQWSNRVVTLSLNLSTNQLMDRWTRTLLIGTMKQRCCNAKSKTKYKPING